MRIPIFNRAIKYFLYGVSVGIALSILFLGNNANAQTTLISETFDTMTFPGAVNAQNGWNGLGSNQSFVNVTDVEFNSSPYSATPASNGVYNAWATKNLGNTAPITENYLVYKTKFYIDSPLVASTSRASFGNMNFVQLRYNSTSSGLVQTIELVPSGLQGFTSYLTSCTGTTSMSVSLSPNQWHDVTLTQIWLPTLGQWFISGSIGAYSLSGIYCTPLNTTNIPNDVVIHGASTFPTDITNKYFWDNILVTNNFTTITTSPSMPADRSYIAIFNPIESRRYPNGENININLNWWVPSTSGDTYDSISIIIEDGQNEGFIFYDGAITVDEIGNFNTWFLPTNNTNYTLNAILYDSTDIVNTNLQSSVSFQVLSWDSGVTTEAPPPPTPVINSCGNFLTNGTWNTLFCYIENIFISIGSTFQKIGTSLVNVAKNSIMVLVEGFTNNFFPFAQMNQILDTIVIPSATTKTIAVTVELAGTEVDLVNVEEAKDLAGTAFEQIRELAGYILWILFFILLWFQVREGIRVVQKTF